MRRQTLTDHIRENAKDFLNISDAIRAHAAERPAAPAVEDETTHLNWQGFDARIDAITAALQESGIGHGDKVAMLARNAVDVLALYMASLRAGACAVPLSTLASPEQLAAMVTDSGAGLLAVDAYSLPLIGPALDRLGDVRLVGFDFGADQAGGDRWTGFADWLAAAPAAPAPVEIGSEDLFNIIYSSGTTGVPKGIVHSHQMRGAQTRRLQSMGFGPDTVSMVSTPIYSNTTLAALLPTVLFGGHAVLMAKFDAGRFLELAAAKRATHAMLVPVQYTRILDHPDFDRHDLSSFQMKLSTSAPLRAETKRDIARRWPGGMVEIYGLTEGGLSCLLDVMAFPDKLDTVGRPSDGAEIRVIDDEGRELPQGQIGELVGRGPAMMSGYHNLDDKTAEMMWHDAEGRLFLRSGDMGQVDEDGFVRLLDRRKDMIISGGFNVYAVDLEAVLFTHPDVADAAVIGIPSRAWGETPLGLVVLKPGATATADEICRYANERLGKAQRLSAVELRDELPRSPIGKVLKRELREPYISAFERAAAV
ncbi:class I adenylate-forming enzyme family protein [Tistrella bauzanensis]|uniref:Class I adenylate-forming enzyme family protein n=1 Tax=Tistrella arctica TaxID=3133430 RepID=A0ABU9YT10_9PROT